ncbi:MAG: rhomboid family intramembrane serine protease [Syntrophomonadaceae bacterium]|jgi:membrane associated rhomboid family serine protease
MIPLRDSTAGNSLPLITILIIITNFYIFINQIGLDFEYMERIFYIFGLVPANFTQGISDLGYIPFLTSMFLHGSWMHIIANMWILWLFGDNVEDRMGKLRFLFFYMMCGTIAGLTHCLMYPQSTIPVVGASGAVAGVMGAYFLMFKHARVLTYFPPFFLINISAWLYLGFWILSQLYAGTVDVFAGSPGNIAFWSHVGGFVAGMIFYRFFIPSGKTVVD